MRLGEAGVAAACIALAVLAMCGCSGSGSDRPYDYAGSRGAALYAELCEVCHGEAGEGGLGPVLQDTALSRDRLVDIIGTRMPQNQPGRCAGDCASEVASFILDGLTSEALRCDAVGPSPRRLRLLTRREYRNTVRDLLHLSGGSGASCERATDCAFGESCASHRCEKEACDRLTFAFDPGERAPASVHLAGSFNGWAGTVAAGGWALDREPASGLWVGTFALAPGTWAYKLVLDERDWIPDPRATASAPDGFGGQNSVLDVSCDGGADDPAAHIPAEVRPPGFAFDDDADAALVTADHLDAYLSAARSLARQARSHTSELAGCDGSSADCGRQLVERLGRRAFRRPLAPDEIDRYAALVAGGDSFADGAEAAIAALLISPSFLYRSEVGVQQDDGSYRLTGWEMATALSYTFWATMPDDALLAAAESGALDDAAGIEREARRLLADPRSREVIGTFTLEWLGAESVTTVDKSPVQFPGFDDQTRRALARETADFAAHVVFDSTGRYGELMTADYTLVDPVAARFYGAGGGGTMPYSDGRRAGLLGHASVLASTAHSDQTSPIRRGLFVRRRLLCQDLPPPPANAGGVPEVDPDASTRERFAQHTADPVCAGCHRYTDGVGFGFESFDPVGLWRDGENGRPVDAAGDMNDLERLGTGTSAPFGSLPELAAILAGSHAAPSCFVRQAIRFARGAKGTLADRCARLRIEDRFGESGGDVQELLLDIVRSPDFAVRR